MSNYSSLIYSSKKSKYEMMILCAINENKNDYQIKKYPIEDKCNSLIEYNNNSGEKEIIQLTINITKEDININNTIQYIEFGKIYEITGLDFKMKISPINREKYEIMTTVIDFNECKDILIQDNNLPINSTLTVLQIEISKKNDFALTDQIEYAVFYENRNQLDLSICKEIKINYEIKNKSKIDIDKINEFKENGIDIFNINDNFFNDICFPYSINNSDIVLKDRKLEIYQNYSLCDNSCEYDGINTTSMRISCICQVKTNIDLKIKPISFAIVFEDSFKDSNIYVIKCYKLVFNLKNKLHNIGFWIFLVIILFHIPLFIHYFIYKLYPINKFIFLEMKNNNYISDKGLNNPPKTKNLLNFHNSIFDKNSSKKINEVSDFTTSKKIILNNENKIAINIYPSKSRKIKKNKGIPKLKNINKIVRKNKTNSVEIPKNSNNIKKMTFRYSLILMNANNTKKQLPKYMIMKKQLN